MSETPASPITPKTARIGRSARRTRSSAGRTAANTLKKTRNANSTRHSARIDGATPALKADFAMIPPSPKQVAAASAKPYPRPTRRGAGPTEGPRAAEGSPPDQGWGYRRVERVSVGPALDSAGPSLRREVSPLPSLVDRGSRDRRCAG